MVDPYGEEFGSIVDSVVRCFTEGNTEYTYICYPERVGMAQGAPHWAIKRVTEITSGGVTSTVIRWAKKGKRAGKAAYFIFKASDYRDADKYFGD